MLLRLLATVCFVWALGVPAFAQDAPTEPPSAQEQEARALFEAGRAAFNDGRFEDSLGYFRQSYELSGRPELLFNIGTSADRLRLNQEALDAFERYLAALPDAPNRREVEGRIRVLRRAMVATPEEAARTETAEPAPSVIVVQDDDTVFETWWFWTLTGTAVAGAIIAVILLTSDTDPQYMLGDDGDTHLTLVGP